MRNRWAHFAHIFNGSEVIIYVDGNLIANWTRGEISTGNADAFQFGRWRNDGNAYFQGRLDDLRVYDSALGGQEILQIFAGDDLEENLIQHQFDLLADGDPTEFSVSGLPTGIELDTVTGEVFGLPQEVGVFDLNVSAFNIAGEGKANLRNSNKPHLDFSSSSVSYFKFGEDVYSVVSDGGEPVQLSFLGETDGGANANIDPLIKSGTI